MRVLAFKIHVHVLFPIITELTQDCVTTYEPKNFYLTYHIMYSVKIIPGMSIEYGSYISTNDNKMNYQLLVYTI